MSKGNPVGEDVDGEPPPRGESYSNFSEVRPPASPISHPAFAMFALLGYAGTRAKRETTGRGVGVHAV